MNNCSVENCGGAVKYKGLCGKHYKRAWRHGSPTKTMIAPKGSNIGVMCSVEGCGRHVHGKGLCKKHNLHLGRYGRTHLIRNENGTGTMTNAGYKLITVNGVRIYEHIYIAEKALGKPLLDKAIVHHADGKSWDNTPTNLVICPDQAYHLLLHQRMKQFGINAEELKRDE